MKDPRKRMKEQFGEKVFVIHIFIKRTGINRIHKDCQVATVRKRIHLLETCIKDMNRHFTEGALEMARKHMGRCSTS